MMLISLCLLLSLIAGLSPSNLLSQTEAPTMTAESWLEADALFRKDPRWLGGDDAYSIDLGDGRVLWLFADSFIATSAAGIRREATMIRNSLAIQQGYDPASASIKFYWGMKKGQPASFFPESRRVWYWPGHGIRIGSTLLIFLLKVRRADEGLGFDVFGWSAVAIDNPTQEPSQWKPRWLRVPDNNFKVIVGSASVLRVGEYVYAFGAQERQGHDVFVVRWPVVRAAQGDLSEPHWWSGTGDGWMAQRSLRRRPSIVFSGGQTEFSVHFVPALKRFIQIQTAGFGAAEMALRWAENPTGPWSDLQRFHRPGESDRMGVLVYAGKAHPELTGADVVLTYVVNHSDFNQLVNDAGLYYPRFLKGTFVNQRPLSP